MKCVTSCQSLNLLTEDQSQPEWTCDYTAAWWSGWDLWFVSLTSSVLLCRLRMFVVCLPVEGWRSVPSSRSRSSDPGKENVDVRNRAKEETCSEINLLIDLVLFHCCHKKQHDTVWPPVTCSATDTNVQSCLTMELMILRNAPESSATLQLCGAFWLLSHFLCASVWCVINKPA